MTAPIHILSIKQKGFTLVELVMVIILLGVVSVAATNFIGLATQSYVNVIDRDELLANARFSVERLNREIRNVLPNSVRETTGVSAGLPIQCIEFVPIKASTIYTDIPVSPEPSSDTITVVKFQMDDGVDYACDATCNDAVVVYPLTNNDIFTDHSDSTGKAFGLKSVTSVGDEWTLTLDMAVSFDSESTTSRVFIVESPVSYCIVNQQMHRYDNYDYASVQITPPDADPDVIKVLMANDVANLDVGNLPFTVLAATLQRNALVQIELGFTRNDENFVFNSEVHISNVP